MTKSNLKYVKKLKQEFSAFEELFNSQMEKIKKEHNKILIQKMNELISNIASNENLDELYLREKYLNIKEEKIKEKAVKNEIEEPMHLLDKIVIDDQTYYYENKDNGKIYNLNTEIVGTYIDSKFNLK